MKKINKSLSHKPTSHKSTPIYTNSIRNKLDDLAKIVAGNIDILGIAEN